MIKHWVFHKTQTDYGKIARKQRQKEIMGESEKNIELIFLYSACSTSSMMRLESKIRVAISTETIIIVLQDCTSEN